MGALFHCKYHWGVVPCFHVHCVSFGQDVASLLACLDRVTVRRVIVMMGGMRTTGSVGKGGSVPGPAIGVLWLGEPEHSGSGNGGLPISG